VQVANYNSPGQVVISGDEAALARASDLAKEAGARRVIPLAVSVATHSPLMEHASEGLRKAIGQVIVSAPRLPVIGNVSAQPLESQDSVEQEMIAQLTSPVRWTASVRYMLDRGVERFVEIGPGNVLTGLVRRIEKESKLLNINDESSLRAFIGQ
jgi:[acyl-carrier-protein] S-malonyltransferase